VNGQSKNALHAIMRGDVIKRQNKDVRKRLTLNYDINICEILETFRKGVLVLGQFSEGCLDLCGICKSNQRVR